MRAWSVAVVIQCVTAAPRSPEDWTKIMFFTGLPGKSISRAWSRSSARCAASCSSRTMSSPPKMPANMCSLSIFLPRRAGPPLTHYSRTLLLRTFDGAPRVPSADASTEMLTYMYGRAAVPPLTADLLTDEALVSIADLLLRFHDAVASFDPAPCQWPRPDPTRFRTRLISHNDVYPGNLVFRHGKAIALIDFDLAGPGCVVWDLASAARTWAPLQDDDDISDTRQGRALARFRIFLQASGLSRANRQRVAEAVVANHDWTYAIVAEAAAMGP
jgi:phosphotransferase family enzyme